MVSGKQSTTSVARAERVEVIVPHVAVEPKVYTPSGDVLFDAMADAQEDVLRQAAQGAAVVPSVTSTTDGQRDLELRERDMAIRRRV